MDRWEKQLATGLRKGKPECFDELYELYKTPIYNFVYQMLGDTEEAKDITQESFLSMYNVMRGKKKIDNLRAYLYAIARNNALRKIEARGHEYVDEDFITRLPDENYYTDPVRFMANRKQQEDIMKALQMMPENYREVLILREQAGFSYETIAKMISTNKSNVGVLIFRARAKFRELYRMLQVTQEPASAECEAMLPLVSSWLDGETSKKQEQALQKHMSDCPFCKLASEQMVEASGSYHAFIPLAVPLAVKAGIMAKAGLAGVVPTSLAAGVAGSTGAAAASAGTAGSALSTGMSAGGGYLGAGIGTGAATGATVSGISAKTVSIAVAAVIALGVAGGGTYTGIRVQAHRRAVALERELKAQIGDFMKGTRNRVLIPPELRKRAGDLEAAAREYMKRYLPDWDYEGLRQLGRDAAGGELVKVEGLIPTAVDAAVTGPDAAIQDCYLEVLREDEAYLVDRMTRESN